MHPYPWYHPLPIATAVHSVIAHRHAFRATSPSAFPILAFAARRPWKLLERVDLHVVVVPVAELVAEPVVALVAAIAAALNTDPAVAPVDQFVVASRATVGKMWAAQVQ